MVIHRDKFPMNQFLSLWQMCFVCVCFVCVCVFFSLEVFIWCWVHTTGDTPRPHLRVTDALVCSRELIWALVLSLILTRKQKMPKGTIFLYFLLSCSFEMSSHFFLFIDFFLFFMSFSGNGMDDGTGMCGMGFDCQDSVKLDLTYFMMLVCRLAIVLFLFLQSTVS